MQKTPSNYSLQQH